MPDTRPAPDPNTIAAAPCVCFRPAETSIEYDCTPTARSPWPKPATARSTKTIRNDVALDITSSDAAVVPAPITISGFIQPRSASRPAGTSDSAMVRK